MKKVFKVLFLTIAVFLVLLVSWLFGPGIKNSYHLIFSPLEASLLATSQNTFGIFKFLLKSQTILFENEELKKENLNFLSQLNTQSQLKEENQALRKALDLKNEKGFNLLLSNVVSLGMEGDVVLIDKGKKDLVQEGMPVIEGQGILLGRVADVMDNFSRVELISFPEKAFEVALKTESEDILASANGLGNFGLGFQWVPKDKAIQEGILIFTSSIGGKYPAGLLVGRISSFENNDTEAFQSGKAKPYFTDIRLGKVFLITNFVQAE